MLYLENLNNVRTEQLIIRINIVGINISTYGIFKYNLD